MSRKSGAKGLIQIKSVEAKVRKTAAAALACGAD